MKKYFLNLAVLCLLIFALPFMLSCGSASQGFNAPFGAKINIDIAPTNAETATIVCYTSQFSVSKDSIPLNNIQAQLGCAFCEIWDKTDGSDYILADTPLEQRSLPFLVKTNSQGFYQIRVCALPPATFGLTEYTAQLQVNIGVDNKTAEFKITSQ